MAILSGDTDLKKLYSLVRRCNVEAVFSAKGSVPGLAKSLLIPYLAMKRGF